MKNKTIQFLENHSDLKSALKELGLSGQQIKKHLSTAQKNLSVKSWQKYEVAASLLNNNRISPTYHAPSASDKVRIIKEDENFLAIEKPHRVHSYPLTYTETDNALSFLRAEGRGSIFLNYEEFVDRNLLFRLDYETAGVLLFAKKRVDLKLLRQEEGHQKIYAAIVEGEFSLKGHFENFYQSIGKKGEKVECHDDERENARLGTLEILGSEYDSENNQSLVFIKLISGVRHQLRSFLKAKEFPILGDELYGGKQAHNLCLHACYYQVENFSAYSKPLFLRDFLDLDSRFQMLCDQFGIG